MIDLRRLRYFVGIVDSGSLTRAATVLHVAQPALSQHMGALETELGTQLLSRSAKGVRPTDAGWSVYRHAQTILKLTAQTQDIARGAGAEVSGRVRIGLTSSIAMILAAPLLAALGRTHPGILLELYESPSSYLSAQLLDERVDLSLLVDRQPSSSLSIRHLLSESLYLVRRRRAGASDAGMSIDELRDVPLILTTRATTLRHLVDEAFAARHVAPRVAGEASSIQTLLAVVAQSEWATLLPFSAVSWSPMRAQLEVRPLLPSLWRPVALAWSRKVSPTAATECVRSQIIDTVGQLVDDGVWQGVRAATAG